MSKSIFYDCRRYVRPLKTDASRANKTPINQRISRRHVAKFFVSSIPRNTTKNPVICPVHRCVMSQRQGRTLTFGASDKYG